MGQIARGAALRLKLETRAAIPQSQCGNGGRFHRREEFQPTATFHAKVLHEQHFILRNSKVPVISVEHNVEQYYNNL